MSADEDAANDAAAVGKDAAARFADFDPLRFEHFVACGSTMMTTLGALGPGARALHKSYLELCAEAVGAGLLGGNGRETLLRLLLTEVVPQQLITARSTTGAAHLMARAWNVGEGALQAPRWVDPYLVATFKSIAVDLNDLNETVVTALERVTKVKHKPSWKEFSTSILDLSINRADFVPGLLHAVAPGLLCVHDRFAADGEGASGLVVAVDHGDGSRVVGPSVCLGDDDLDDGFHAPDVEAGDGVAIIGTDVVVEVPTLRRSFWSACLPRGFVAVSVVDSQRLWLLESLKA